MTTASAVDVEHGLRRAHRYANMRGPFKRLRRFRYTASMRTLVTICATSLVILVMTLTVAWLRQPYAPLYGYDGAPGRPGVPIINLPRDSVSTSANGVAKVPVLTVVTGREVVTTQGQKCNHEDHDVVTTVHKQWVEVRPPGYVAVAPVADPVVRPGGGCFVVQLDHQIPDAVLARVKDQAEHGVVDTTWTIQARETPDHPDSASAKWSSIVFVVRYQGAS